MISLNSSLNIYESSKVTALGYRGGFATRAQGDGRDLRNIKRFLASARVGYQTIVVPKQVHKDTIAHVASQDKVITLTDIDGVYTFQPKTALTIISADCVPIIYADKMKGVVAISHQGWRGLRAKLPMKMIGELSKAGSRKQDIVCAIGPAIGACCYEVGNDVYQAFQRVYANAVDRIFEVQKGRKYLNLIKLSYLLLIEAGVSPDNIDYFPFCTHCDKRFYSARRAAPADFSRQFSFIVKS